MGNISAILFPEEFAEMNEPLVSVICGFFNRPSLVARTLSGIKNQTYKNIEVIVFDDASTDNTFDVICKFVNLHGDDRFKVYRHEKNIGFTRGIINAINKSSGEFIVMHDSGDYSFPRRIELQLKEMLSNKNISVVGSHYVNHIDKNGFEIIRKPNHDDATYEDIVSDSGFTHGEVMIRRSFYDRVGGYREEFKFSQDSDLWLRLIKISKFKTVKEILYVRHIQFSGISYKPDSFAAQAAFYEFARFVSGSADGGASLLTGLPDRNIFDVYSYERVDVQKRIFRGALRGVLFGDYIQAKEVAKKYVANKYKKIIVIFASVVLAGCFGKIINPVVRNIFGMKSHGYANLEKIEHI